MYIMFFLLSVSLFAYDFLCFKLKLLAWSAGPPLALALALEHVVLLTSLLILRQIYATGRGRVHCAELTGASNE